MRVLPGAECALPRTTRLVVPLLILFRCCRLSLSFCGIADNHQWRARTLLSAVSSSASPIVLTVGDALFDCIANDDARGFSVEEMVEEGKWTPFPGGAPANVATALRKLGTASAFCGCLGTDEDGDALEALLRDEGVDLSLLQRTADSPTRRVMVTRSAEGDREFGGFWQGRSAGGFADCLLVASSIPSGDCLADRAEWIVCSTLGLAFPESAAATRTLVERALEGGAKLCVDVNWRPVFWPDHPEEEARREILEFCRRARVVKMTDEEAEWLLPVSAEEALAHPAKMHKDHFPDALAVLVTAGEKGAAYSVLPGSGCEGLLPPFRVPVVETTGAGDAFTAGFLHGILAIGDDVATITEETKEIIHNVVRFAAAVGALTCTKEGAIASQPTLAQVESFLIHGEVVWD